jgi:hypothetical protein
MLSLATAGSLGLVSWGTYPAPSLPFGLLLVAALLFTGYDALRCLRDLASGVALVQEDLLKRLSRGPRRKGRRGSFQHLGEMWLTSRVFFQSSPGRRYRVVYSPASRTVWALEPPDERISQW